MSIANRIVIRLGSWGRWLTLGAVSLATAIGVFQSDVVRRTHTFYAGWDASIQSYAWNVANARAARALHVKLWDFTTSSGTSFAGEMQTAPFYPVTWLFAPWSSPTDPEVQEWRLIFHYALAFMGAYLLFRHNRSTRLGAGAGAIICAYAGSIALRAPGQPNIFESLVYLPLILLLCQRACEHGGHAWKNAWAWLAGTGCAFMMLAGHLQPPIHAGFAAGIMGIVLGWPSPRRIGKHLLTLAFVGLVAAAIASPQLIATGEYLAHSYRWIGADKPTSPPHVIPYAVYGFNYVLKLADFRSLFYARHEGEEGATLFITLTGLALAVIALWKPRRWVIFMLILGGLAILIAMGDATPLGQLSYHTPGLNMVRQPVRILCLYHLAAAALIAVGCDRLVRWRPRGLVVGPALAVLTLAAIADEAWHNAQKYMQPRTAALYPGNYYNNTWINTAAAHTLDIENGPTRYMALPNDAVPPNLGNATAALSMRGHRATMQMRYFNYLGRDWSPASENFRRLGLRYIFSAEPVAGFHEIAHQGNLGLYERPDALGIFQIVEGYHARRARVTAVDWSDNRVSLQLTPTEEGRLVFAQARYPGWKAKIDGRPTPLIIHDIFFAIDVPPGSRRLEFIYSPWWLWPSLLLSLATLSATFIACLRNGLLPVGRKSSKPR